MSGTIKIAGKEIKAEEVKVSCNVDSEQVEFFLEKGVRFAQLLDFQADGVMKKYDGDYQED